MDEEKIVRAINSVYKRLNEVEAKVERFLLDKHEINADAIAGSEEAVLEVAGMAADNAEAIQGTEAALLDLAGMIAELHDAN